MCVCCSVLQFVAVCCSVLQCVAVCCSALQCVAVCCSVQQCRRALQNRNLFQKAPSHFEKRPCMSNQTRICEKRPIFVKGALQKRPTHFEKRPMYVKSDLYM